jgi:hypothetical protein
MSDAHDVDIGGGGWWKRRLIRQAVRMETDAGGW